MPDKDNYIALSLLKKITKGGKPSAIFLGQTQDVSSINVLARGKSKEFINFASRGAASNITNNEVHGKWSDEISFIVHGIQVGQLVLVLISRDKLQNATATQQLKKIMNRVVDTVPPNYTNIQEDQMCVDLNSFFQQIQSTELSQIQALNKELDEVKGAVYDNLQSMMKRDAALEDMLKDSKDLDDDSKKFLQDSKKIARCLGI